MKIKTMKFKMLVGFILIWALPAGANASDSKVGPFVEPSITYESGDTSVNFPSPLHSSTGSANGLGVGARIGFHLYDVFFLGLDGRYSMPQYKDSSVNYDASAVATNWGPVAGIQMPNLGLRVWGAIILGGNLNPEKSGNFDVNFKDTSGFRIGAGFRVAAVSLNLEYQQLEYAQTNLEQLGPFSTGTVMNNVTLDNNSWIASVSFPIEL